MALRGWFEDNELTPNEWLELLFEYLRGQDTDDIDRIYRRDEAQELKELFTRYADGQASADELIAFELNFLKDIEGVADWWDQTVSIVEADRIIETMEDNPNGLQYLPSPTGTKTTEYLETAAMSFTGATPTTPITTVGNKQVVLRGGAGVTINIEDILQGVGGIREGGESLERILDAIVPYIPGVSLPNWMPTAGVIFLPSVGKVINKVNDVAGQIGDAIESGESLEDILGQVGAIVVQEAEEITDELRGQWEGLRDTITEVFTRPKTDEDGNIIYTTDEEGNRVPEREVDPTGVSTVLAGVVTGSYPDLLPSWMPDLLGGLLIENLPNVYSAVRSTLIQSGATTEELFPPLEEEVVTEQDPALMFTHRGDNFFVNKTEDEYFQLAESEDFVFEMDGEYTRQQLQDTGLETVSSGTYQSLLDDYSFYALTEDIYEYPIEELIARYEAEGGILPDDWDLLDDESKYNFFIDESRAVEEDEEVVTEEETPAEEVPTEEVPTEETPTEEVPPEETPTEETPTEETSDEEAPAEEEEQDVTSIVEGLFADFLEQLDEEFTGQQEQINEIIQNFVNSLPDFDAMPTMEDIAEYFEVNGVTLSEQNFERIRQELADAGYLTQEQLTEALAGVATTEQVQEAIQNAGFATPEQVMQYLAEAGYATPEDITNALANSGFVTEDRLLQALAEAGYATPEQVQQIVDNAISNIVIPEGATAEEVRQLIQEAIDGIPEGISLSEVSDIVNEAIANIEFPESLSEGDVRGIVDSFGFATSEEVQAGFDDLNQRFEDAINGIATQFSDQEAEFLASITGLEASLIQSLAAVEGGLSTELEMLGADLISLQEDVAGRFDEFEAFTSQQFELAATERQQLQQAIIAANGDITQLSADMQQMFADFGGTVSDLFAGVGVDIEALQAGQITQQEALDQLRTSIGQQFTTAQEERQELQQAIIAVGGDVSQLSDDMMLRFQQQDQTIEELFAGTNVNIEALRQGQITQQEALDAYQQYTAEQFGQAQQDRLALAQEIISVGGQVEALSADSQQRFAELGLSLADLQEEFNVNLIGLQQGQISQAEAFGQFRDSVTTRLGLAEEEREEILTRQAEFERVYGEEQQALQEQITTGNLLTVLAGGGMFGGGAAPARAPYKEFMKGITYRPREAPELAIKTPAVDYNEEAQKLLMRTRRRGMLV